jgi:hypothetical protein
MGLTRLRAEQISDIDYKQAVRVITISNITLSGGAPSLVDGVTVSVDDRVLVTGQSTGSQNGIYQVQTVGTGSNGTWIRSTDTNATGELEAGTIVMVTEGTTYADTQWKLTTNNPIIIGTTALTFEQNSAYAFGNIYANGTAVLANSVGSTVTFTAGNNISITGNNTSKTVTIGVTGISLNSISNGTSNVNVVSSGGNVTVGVGGTANVAVFATANIVASANLLPSANVTYDLGSTSARWKDLWLSNSTLYLGNTAIATTAGVLTVNGANVLTGNAGSALSTTGNITGGNILTGGLISATGTITSSANVIGSNIVTAGVVTATGNITGGNLLINGSAQITGNLSVLGTETIFNVANLTVNDKDIIVANNVTGGANIDGAGIQAGNPATATWFFNNATTSWQSNIGITPTANGTLSLGGASNYWGNAFLATATVTSNITGGNLTTAGQAVATGNITGGNIRTAGVVSATGDVFGKELWSTQSSGDEGGQVNLSIPATNTALTGQVTIDVYQNRLRFFQGDGARGAYIDLTQANVGVGTNLLAGGGGGTPGGANTNVQFNDGGLFGGTAGLTFNKTTNAVATTGTFSATGNVAGGNLLTAGSISAAGNITGLNLNSSGADLAEKYVADSDYTPGTVVEFGGTNEITISTQSHSTRVAGIVSTSPGHLMNVNLLVEHVTEVALTGRVPCQVIGKIQKGDCIVSSLVPGVATALDRKLYEPGCIIGKSLETYDSDQIGTIEVAVGRF